MLNSTLVMGGYEVYYACFAGKLRFSLVKAHDWEFVDIERRFNDVLEWAIVRTSTGKSGYIPALFFGDIVN